MDTVGRHTPKAYKTESQTTCIHPSLLPNIREPEKIEAKTIEYMILGRKSREQAALRAYF